MIPEGPVPLSPMQHWFFENPTGRPESFIQPMLLLVPADIELARVREAFDHLLARHDVLGYGFRRDGETVVQNRPDAPLRAPVSEVDLGSVEARSRPEALRMRR